MSSWLSATIGELAEKIAMGPFGSNIKVETFVASGIPIISGQHLHKTRLDESSGYNFITEEHAVRLKNSIVGPEDIIFTHAGTIGQVSRIPADAAFGQYVISQRQFYLRLNRTLADPMFVTYWFHGPVGRHRLLMHASQVGVPSISRPATNLRNIEIELPPLPEQRAIAATLGALDDKIELNRRMNATLEAMARALFRDWFVDFGPTRAKMAGGKPYLSPDLWSLFPDRLDGEGKPEGWEFETVIDQADWINGAAYKNMHFSDAPDALPVIKIAELKNGVTGKTAWTATDLGSRYLIDDGELLFSWSGNPDTSIDTFLWSGGKAWLNQHIFAVRETGKRSKPFLHAMLKFLKPELSELARNKQTTGLGHVTKADMKRMLICTAPESIHQAFDKLITPIFDRAFLLQMESRTLAQTRDLLLPRLMSGELRVADLDPAAKEIAL